MVEVRIKTDESLDKALQRFRKQAPNVKRLEREHSDRHLGQDRTRRRPYKNRPFPPYEGEDTVTPKRTKEYRPQDRFRPGDVLRNFRREYDGLELMLGVSDPAQLTQQAKKVQGMYDKIPEEQKKLVEEKYKKVLQYL